MPNWADVLHEIESSVRAGRAQQYNSLDLIRRKYIENLKDHTDRNVIAYYSSFLSKPSVEGIDITDEDKNGFMMAVHELDKSKGLDLLLHTPGGSVAAAESIVNYLKSIFGNNIRAIVPQIAMSAGTMIACSCKSIVMGKQSNLGPIDPHIGGIPAVIVKKEFERAYEEIKEDNIKAAVWQPIIGKYPPTFLDKCELAVEWAAKFVEEALSENMLSEHENATEKAKKLVESLSSAENTKAHDRHIHIQECKDIGLVIEDLEDDDILQDIVLTVHHCYMHTLSNTGVVKIVENQLGKATIRSVAEQD